LRTSRGTFLGHLLTSHAVVLEKKSKKYLGQSEGSHLGFLIKYKLFKKIHDFFRTPRGTIAVSLIAVHAVVLKKFKM